MKFRNGIFYLIFFLISGSLAAQKKADCAYQIQGKVYELDTKAGMPYVNIQLDGTNFGTVTDETGFFEFRDLCEDEYDIIFSFLGYKTAYHHHDFHHPFLEIFLAPEGYLLESVVVEAASLQSGLNSISTSKLSNEDLEAVASESLGDALSKIAGVGTLKTGQNIVKPIIHGLHSNRILIINSGVRHEFQSWGSEHAPEIDPSLVDEIEVVKGAGTVRFGPDALGGVILINPPKMELSNPLQGKIQLTGKSNGRSGEGTVELRKGFKWLSLVGGGSWIKQGDLQAPDYSLTNTGKEETSFFGGFRLHPLSKLDIEGYYSHFEQNLGILSGSVFGNLEDLQRALEADTPFYTMPFSYDINDPRQEVKHDLFKASMRYVGNDQSLHLQYGHQLNRRKEYGVRRSEAPNINLELLTQTIDADWNHPKIGKLSGKLGAQWLKKANDNLPGTNTVAFIPNYDEERLGIFLIESLDLGKSTLELGARFDYMESDIVGRQPDNIIYRNKILYRNFSGTIGLKTQFNEHASFQSNFGTAWRPPDVAELYRFGQHAFFLEYGLWRYTFDEQFDFISTRKGILTKEDRPVPSEVGYKWINTYSIKKPGYQSEVTFYVNYIQNYIYAKPAGLTSSPRGFFVFFIYDQTDALLWGIDVSNQWTHSPKFSSGLNGSFLWAKQLSPSDFFAGMPPPQLEYELNYRPGAKWLKNSQLNLSLNYTFEQFQHPRILSVDEFLAGNQEGIDRFKDGATNFDLLSPPPAFLLTDISWTSSWRQLSWRLQVRNLFNVSYRNYTDRMRYFADDLGRNLILGLTLKI